MKLKRLILLAMLCALPILVGCDDDTDDIQQRETEQMVSEANAQVGMPDIKRFTERRFAKQILELRDNEVVTYSYTVNAWDGKLNLVCQSVGYGLPYSVQYVNPQRGAGEVWGADYYHTVPQPEPNGLFMPDGLSATWILCADPEGGPPRPIYSEPNLLVSPFPLVHSNSYQ
jgi:hypothetical protein